MPLLDPDEPRYASTARDMILNGNWIVPHFNGVPRINKPPLFYWTVAVSYKIFGVNEFGARFPSALAAAGTVLIAYVWGKRLGDSQKGFWSAFVLMSSPLFFVISRFCITDMLLTFFVCASLFLFFSEYTETNNGCKGGFETRPGRRLFLYFFLAMVFLVKGPVGILLFILVILCFLLWIRDFQYVRRLWYFPGFLLFLGIICVWGIPFWLSLGTKEIITLFTRETSGRFVSGYAHPEPFYYYLQVFLIGYFPWSLYVCAMFVYLVKKRNIFSFEEKRQIYFFCSWLIVTVGFFSLSHSKLMTYILPVSPAIALLAVLPQRWENEGRLWKGFGWMSWFISGLSAAIPVILLTTMQKWVPAKYGFPPERVVIPIITLFTGEMAALFVFIIQRRYIRLQKIFCFAGCLFFVVTMISLSRYLGTFRSTKDIVEKGLLVRAESRFLLSNARVVPSLVFYSGKAVKSFDTGKDLNEVLAEQEETVSYMIMELKDYKKKGKVVQGKGFHVVCQNKAHVLLKRE